MITKYDVEMAYKLLLGRDPESNDVVKAYVNTCEEIGDLRAAFMHSHEFKGLISSIVQLPEVMTYGQMNGNEKSIHIDVRLEKDILGDLYKRVESVWTNLGKLEPHWAVLSADCFKSSNLNENIDAFYASGKREAELLFDYANRNNIYIPRDGSCLEFGCGVGRITRWLAEEFKSVVAVDISEPMLKLSGEYLNRAGINNVDMRHLTTLSSLSNQGSYDSIISFIVIQHNPPPIMLEIIRMLLSRLKSGGVALFQIPTYALGYEFHINKYLKNESGEIEMHCLPQREIFSVIKEQNCHLLEVNEDNLVGIKGWRSNTFFIQKS